MIVGGMKIIIKGKFGDYSKITHVPNHIHTYVSSYFPLYIFHSFSLPIGQS